MLRNSTGATDRPSVSECRSATASAARLNAYAYAALALGLVLYIVAIWFQVYIDTRRARTVAPDRYFEGHRHWRMRTALVFLIWSVLGGLTLPIGIGWLILIPAYLWYLYRVAKGIVWFALGRPLGMEPARVRAGSPQ